MCVCVCVFVCVCVNDKHTIYDTVYFLSGNVQIKDPMLPVKKE